MSAVPQSFSDFGEQSLRPDYVVKSSYGNDSISLIQFMHEYNLKHPLGRVICLFNDTKWAAPWWMKRVENCEENLVKRYGFIPARTSSIGMHNLINQRKAWPDPHMRFCTEELKIKPTKSWLAIHDPDGIATMVCGVRREESSARRLWPEWVDGSDKNEGRDEWAPNVEVKEAQRDEMIVRAGMVPLAHRSRECKCILANAADLKTWTEDMIVDIEVEEAFAESIATRPGGSNALMFKPSDKKGRPHGIRDVVKWAHGVKTKEEPQSSCDSGYCVS